MDSDFVIDLEELFKNVQNAEVISLFFPLLRKVLLVDTRHDDVEGPLIRVVPMVSSSDERVRELRRLRPRFGRPQSLTLIPWPKFVDSVERLGVLQALIQRVVLLGYVDRIGDFRGCMDQLREFEQAELVAAIQGENYETLWQRSGAS
jgi:hypothetical protein